MTNIPEISSLQSTRNQYHDLILAQLTSNAENTSRLQDSIDDLYRYVHEDFRKDFENIQTRVVALETRSSTTSKSIQNNVEQKRWYIAVVVSIISGFIALIGVTYDIFFRH